MNLNIGIKNIIMMEGLFKDEILQIGFKRYEFNKVYLKRYSETCSKFFEFEVKLISSFEDLFKSFNDKGLKVFLVATKINKIRECFKGIEREKFNFPVIQLEKYEVIVAKDEEDAATIYSELNNSDSYHTVVLSEITV